MNTYRKNGSSTKRTRKSKQLKQPKQKDLTKYLTLDYVRRALAVIDHRLERRDARTAKYVLEMYFGKAGVARAEKKAARTTPERKPNLHVSSEFIEKLAQKYFPKPNWNPQQSTNGRINEGTGGMNPGTGNV